jgi:hypothetical protein
MAKGMALAMPVVFEHNEHMIFAEEAERHVASVLGFLRRHAVAQTTAIRAGTW